MKLCECGCGEPAPIAKMTSAKHGWRAGEPVRFIGGHNQRLQKRTSGYRMVVKRDHPRASTNGCVQEHVLIAERALARILPIGAEIHHVDENPLNNANKNLVICENRRYHFLLHVRARVLRAGGNPNTQRVCCVCRRAKDFSEFNVSRRNVNGGVTTRCRECNRAYCRKARPGNVGKEYIG